MSTLAEKLGVEGPRVEFYESGEDADLEGVSSQWRWRVLAGNNEIVASGEGYTRKADAERGFEDAAEAIRVALIKLLSEKRATE